MTGRDVEAAADSAAVLLGRLARRRVPLAPYTTLRLGGPALLLVDADTVDDLVLVASAAVTTELPVIIIGQGSNLLVSDEGFSGIVVVLGDGFSGVDTGAGGAASLHVVRAGGAVKLPVLARRTVAASLTGLEWAVGVPGSVGGAVRMNAGGHGSDVAATLSSVEVLAVDRIPAEVREMAASELALAYRASALGPAEVVIGASFVLGPGDRVTGEAELADIVRWRREHQPGGANCGSVFTNPPGDSAGRLIDRCGLKGHRIGGAHVSVKHANFIQTEAGATSQDVRALINYVRDAVVSRAGIALHPEVRTAGFSSPLFEETP